MGIGMGMGESTEELQKGSLLIWLQNDSAIIPWTPMNEFKVLMIESLGTLEGGMKEQDPSPIVRKVSTLVLRPRLSLINRIIPDY